MLSWIQRNYPVHITGALWHSIRWGFYGFEGVVYKNPKFDTEDYIGTEGVGIYCIHGTADKPKSSFQLLTQRLFDSLPGSISSVHLVAFKKRGRGTTIEEYAQQLKTIIGKKHKKVILMGHSRGGLVVAYFIENLAKEADIEVLVSFSMGSPYKGSSLAILPFTHPKTSIKQMAKQSEFLQALEAKVTSGSTPYWYITARHDYIVPPHAASLTVPGHVHKTLERHGHLSMMSSKVLVEMINEVLHRVCPKPLLSTAELKASSPISQDYVEIDFTETKEPAELKTAVGGKAVEESKLSSSSSSFFRLGHLANRSVKLHEKSQAEDKPSATPLKLDYSSHILCSPN